MRFDRSPLLITVQDKFAVQQYARERGVCCAPLLHVTGDPATIPFDSLPANCMIKATHGCAWNIARMDSRYFLFGDGSHMAGHGTSSAGGPGDSPKPLSVDEVIVLCRKWLASRLDQRAWAYQPMTPRIIVEETLVAKDGPELLDFRLYTFHGEVKAINIGSARFRRDHVNVFLRPDWSVIPVTRYAYSLPDPIPPCPSTLPQMIDIARRLGESLDFARIDLYDTTRGVVLGEMTIYPDAGLRNRPSGCPVLDAWLGAQWTMRPVRHCTAVAWNIADWTMASHRELMERLYRRFGSRSAATRA